MAMNKANDPQKFLSNFWGALHIASVSHKWFGFTKNQRFPWTEAVILADSNNKNSLYTP